MRYAHVVAIENHRVLFRGYVQKPKIKNLQTRELACKGEEDLLLRRFAGRFAYQAGERRLYHAFQSDAPNQTADAYGVVENLGLLFMANSMIPFYGTVTVSGVPEPHYDWDAYGTLWIYRLPGLGLKSRIGNANIYAEGKLLPRVFSFPDLLATNISCFSDQNDLYVRLHDSAYYTSFGPRYTMLAENCYDTGIRQGTIDLPETILTGNLQLNFDNRLMDVIKDLAEFYGLNPRFRRDFDYTYMDFLDNPVENEFTITEENIAELTQQYNEDQKVHALIGLGYGSRDVQHVYAPSDHDWKGVWISDTIDVEDGFVDSVGNLKPYTDAEYAYRQNDNMFIVTPTPDWKARPNPNDIIHLKLNGEAETSFQVASCTINDQGKYEMEIGGRRSDLIDAFNGRGALDRVYLNEYLVQYGKTVTASGTAFQISDKTHSCAGASLNVTIPADVYEPDLSHRVTLDVSISADIPPVACTAIVQVNGSSNMLSQPRHYLLGDPINGLDITALCNYGAQSTIVVWVAKNGEWPGAACANHPTMDVTLTIKYWKRTILGSDIKRGLNKQKIIYATWKKVKGNVYRWLKA